MEPKIKKTLLLIFILFIILNTTIFLFIAKGQQEIPVSLSKNSTKFEYGKKIINESVKLTIAIKNDGENDTFATLRVTGEKLKIYPEENQTVIVASGWSVSNFYYYVTSNETGFYVILIELYYNGQKVDSYPLSIEFEEPKEAISFNVTSYQFILFLVYFCAIYLVILSYFKSFFDEGLWNFIVLSLVFSVFIVVFIEPIGQGLEAIISLNETRVEPILFIIVILSIAMLILLPVKKPKYSIIIANITLFMIPLPIILDWIIPPGFFPAWSVIIYLIASTVFSYCFEKFGMKIWKKDKK